jgi:hypothetical protein
MTAVMKNLLACFLALLAVPPAAMADDLVAKRATCVELARDRISTRGRANSDIYRVLVERRRTFVQKCMAETGSSTGAPRLSPGSSS